MSDDDDKVPRPPKGTGTAGRKLWQAVVANYVLAEHELAILREAVAVADTCVRLQEIVAREGDVISDRFGQPRTHPSLIELRNERSLLAKLCVALRVPIGDAELEPAKSSPLPRAQRRGTRGFYGLKGVS